VSEDRIGKRDSFMYTQLVKMSGRSDMQAKLMEVGGPMKAVTDFCWDNGYDAGFSARPHEVRIMVEALERIDAFLEGKTGDSLNSIRHEVRRALGKGPV